MSIRLKDYFTLSCEQTIFKATLKRVNKQLNELVISKLLKPI